MKIIIKCLVTFCAINFTLTMNAFSQEDLMITHKVDKGETVESIAKKYSVKASDIYKLNPDAQNKLKPKTVLLIPKWKADVAKKYSKTAAKEDEQPAKKQDATKKTAPETTDTGNTEEKTKPKREADVTNRTETAPTKQPQPTAKLAVTQPKPAVVETKQATTQTPEKGGINVHSVAAKETIYGISRQYGVTVSSLKQSNPELETDGLKIGQVLIIPSSAGQPAAKPAEVVAAPKPAVKPASKAEPTQTPDKKGGIYHEVLAKETKYSISRKYGLSVSELESKNPAIVSGLQIGVMLYIGEEGAVPNATSPQTPAPAKTTPTAKTPSATAVLPVSGTAANKTDDAAKKYSGITRNTRYVGYEIRNNETLASLSEKFGITNRELKELNPDLEDGVVAGMIIIVPDKNTVSEEPKKEYVTLFNISKSGKNSKQLVLLMPFNVDVIENDSIKTLSDRLKKDKFLNMTLDFYSGAMIALDSLSKIGISLDVKIYDSKETKAGSDVTNLIASGNIEYADAVIGPFYQSNVDKTAEMLSARDVPVISPLSKEEGKGVTNLFNTMPNVSTMRDAVLGYIGSKGGNIIAVIDTKRESTKQHLVQSPWEIAYASVSSTDDIVASSFNNLLVDGVVNYVIVDTKSTRLFKSTIDAMLKATEQYKVQLVLLEQNDITESDEVPFESLATLRLTYPSVSRENVSAGAKSFEAAYKLKNKVLPNTFATRGFDITFDTAMRLAQDKGYKTTAETLATEQIDNKFEYYKKEDGGYINKGVYILYYDTDLYVKEAK